MKTDTVQRVSPRRPLWSFVIITLMGSLAAEVAVARDHGVSVTSSGGKSAQRSVSRAPGQVSSSSTGPNGSTSSRAVQRTAQGAQAAITGPNGQSTSRSTSRTDSGSSTTVTGANGQSTTVNVSRQP